MSLSRWERLLLAAVLLGVVAAALAPEAGLLLSAVDAVGLDVVTILVALELRHYIATCVRIAAAPLGRVISCMSPVPVFGPYATLIRACPARSSNIVSWALVLPALAMTWLILVVRRFFLAAAG
jgi:hypothetical protein